MLVFMFLVATMCGMWEFCCVAAVVKDSVFWPGVMNYVIFLCKDGCCVFSLNCEAWSCRCSCNGSVRVLNVFIICRGLCACFGYM